MSQPALLTLHAPDISRRFLARTRIEVARSRDLFGQYLQTPNSNLSAIKDLAHKIHGSGALFGFHVLSRCAQSVEKIAAGKPSAEQSTHLETALRALEIQIEAELRGRGDPG